MRTLYYDIETAPGLGWVWGAYDQYLSPAQIKQSARMLCFAARWEGEKKKHFYSEYHHGKDEMLAKAWELLDEADVVVHWNGARFDDQHMAREFLLHRDFFTERGQHGPPSPFKALDLCKVVKKRFRFMMNRLDHIADELEIGHKLKHEGFDLWLKCMGEKDGQAGAWRTMKKYNLKDVDLLVEAHEILRPWIPNHPSVPLMTNGDPDACPVCGANQWTKWGFYYTPTFKYQRYRCGGCGATSRDRKNAGGVTKKQVS